MRPGPSGSPGMAISSPVPRMATRGRRTTFSQGRFMAASSAIWRGPSRQPAAGPASPWEKSSPPGRTWRPRSTGASTVTTAPWRRVFSWMTTLSAPWGRGPPVKMRTAWPAFSAAP